MASEDEEVAALDRVLTRTVLTKDEDLQQLLVKLLPALVQKLATTQPKTRAKVLELLNHINKRVKALPGTALPLLPLVRLALAAESGPMVRSFALVYVELGQPRAPAAEQLAAVPLLLTGISTRPAQHKAVALRAVTAALSLLQPAPGGSYSQVVAAGSSTPINAVSLLPPAAADRAVLLSHALKLMLYQRPSSGSRAPATPLGLASAAAGLAAAAAPAAPPPAGLSAADVAALEEKGVPSQDVLIKQKLGLMAVLAGAAAGMPGNAAAKPGSHASASAPTPAPLGGSSTGNAEMEVDGQQPQPKGAAQAASAPPGDVCLSAEELLLVLLAASCDPYEAVARRGSDLLLKLVNPDAARPAVDLESQPLVNSLMALMLGDQYPAAPSPAPTPAGPALAVRIMQLLVRSVCAARTFPAAAIVMSSCLYGPSSSPRLVRLGAEWAGWVFKHAHQHQLKAMAGPVLSRLLAAVGLQEGADAGGSDPVQVDGAGAAGGGVSSLAGNNEARGHVFSALAHLTKRLPELFQEDTALASRLFAALSAEPPGSRAALQEALGALAAAMAGGIAAAGAGTAATVAGVNAAAAAATAGGVDADKQAELEELLMKSIVSDQASVRLCAAQWATRLFPRSHIPSRYICLLATGDSKPEVREVGLSGLGLAATQLPADAAPSAYRAAVADLGLPHPGDIIAHMVARHKQLGQPGDLSRPLPLPDPSCKALVGFIRAAATAAGASSSDSNCLMGYSLSAHALLLENLACRAAGRETTAAALEGLVELLGLTADWLRGEQQWQQQAKTLQERYCGRQSWTSHWLGHHHLPVRLAAARLTALAATAAEPAAADALMQQLLDNFPALETAPGAGGSGGSKLEQQEGCILAAGLLAARGASCGWPEISSKRAEQAINALALQLQHNTEGLTARKPAAGSGSSAGRNLTLAGAAAIALGWFFLGCDLKEQSRTQGRSLAALAALHLHAEQLSSDTAAATDKSAGQPSGSNSTAADIDTTAPASRGSVLLSMLLALAGNGKDSRAAVRAVTALGYAASSSTDGELPRLAAEGLLTLASEKGLHEDLLLGLGEAAAAIAGDITGFNAELLLWSNLDSITDCVDAVTGGDTAPAPAGATAGASQQQQQQQQQQGQAAADMEVDKPAAAAAAGGGGCSSHSRPDLQEYLLSELTGKLAVSSREEVRCAACLLLVSLLQLSRGSSLIASRLPQLQATFTGLLGDNNELTQDLAARGVSLVYSRGGSGLQQQLLGQLLGLLQGAPAAAGAGGTTVAGAAGVKLAADTKVFEEGQLGSTPGGGSLTTYRELCSLATELGQPDLVYKFMELARASSALTAKRGAAVGVARIARLAAQATGSEQGGGLAALLGPERMAALLPKLYRLTHDPSPKVADSMSAIWAALLDDPRAALDNHFSDIAKSLLVDVGARMWRVRQAACASLTDLLAGRRWGQLAPHMEQLWVMALRALDDVKESVRSAAGGLVRALRGLSLRIMDVHQTPAADVSGCCKVVLPLLCGSQGLASSVAVARDIAADVVCTGVKTAGATQVLPVLPTVVPVLLEALSGMEDARLNYVEQHAESIGLDANQLAAARLAAARASSITEALDAAGRALSGPAAVEMTPALVELVRRGVGLNSKVGTANFIRGLAVRLGQELKPGAPALLKSLVNGVCRESSAPVKRAYAAAAAALAVRCVGEKRRDKFVTDSVGYYGATLVPLQPWYPGQPQGGSHAGVAPMVVDDSTNNEDVVRQAGGLLLRELLRESSDTFNTYASQILPVAFLASHDEASSVASAWGTVWSQGCSSEPATLRMHAAELAGLVVGGLGSSAWPLKRSASKALCALAETAADQLAPYSSALANLLLAEVSGGRLWEGKEVLLAAIGALGAACASTLVQNPGIPGLLSGLLSAAARKKTVYRIAALAALHKVLSSLQPLARPHQVPSESVAVDGDVVWAIVFPPLLEALQQHLAAATAHPQLAVAGAEARAAEVEGAEGVETKPWPLVEACSCLTAAWHLLPPSGQAVAAIKLVPCLLGLMVASGIPWSNWLAVVEVAQAVIASASSPTASSGVRSGVSGAACVPLAGGLAHVIQHSTVSQLRAKCLEALVQLLRAIAGDKQAAKAFNTTCSTMSNESLADVIATCTLKISSQDPSAALKALAVQAASFLGQINEDGA